MQKATLVLAFILTLPLLPIAGASTAQAQDNPTVGSNLTILSPCNRTYQPGDAIVVEATSVSMLGGNLIYNGAAYVDGTPYPLHMESSQRYDWDPFFGYLTGTATLPKLPEGQHNLTVYMETFIGSNLHSPAAVGEGTVFFSIADKTPPNITLTSIEDVIYNQTSIPLNFTVNEPAPWVAYSLDGGEKIAVTGNTTLTATTGDHSLVLYANDTSGNLGKSAVAHFTVQIPAFRLETGDLIVLAAIVVASAVAIAAAVLSYSRMRRRESPK